MARHILHVDCNAFYASVEQQRRPELRGKPVAVCGLQEDRHGIVLTASYPAKRLGVKTGMAIWQARQRCPDLAVLPPDMGEYIRISRLARDIYERFTDQVEPFGPDEAWLDITESVGLFGTPTINDVLQSPWITYKPDAQKSASTDRVLRSTKLEDGIYADLRDDDPKLERIEQAASAKMASFPALTRDVFQLFYSLMPRRQETGLLSAAVQQFNALILDHVLAHEDYPTIKVVCKGRELPAYEAAAEFIAKTAGELEGLLSSLGGDKGSVNTLEKLEVAQAKAESELSAMLERMEKSGVHNETLEQAIIEATNTAESKRRQVEAVGRRIAADAAQSQDEAAKLVARLYQPQQKRPRKSNASLCHGVMSPAAWRNMFLTAKYWTWFGKVMYSNACRSIWADFVKYLLRESATAMPMVGVRNTLWNLAGS